MVFLLKLLYYTLLLLTAVLAAFFLYTGLMHWLAPRRPDPTSLKIILGLCSVPVLGMLWQAYRLGEYQGRLWAGTGMVALSWLMWLVPILIVFFVVKSNVQ